MSSYRDLHAWKLAMELVKHVYQVTSNLPTDEKFGLISQMRRAAVSVPANIAEGYGRRTRGEYLHALGIANGSLKELETLVILIRDLELAVEDGLLAECEHVGKVMFLLMRSLQA